MAQSQPDDLDHIDGPRTKMHDAYAKACLQLSEEYRDEDTYPKLCYVVGNPETYRDRLDPDRSDLGGTVIDSIGDHDVVRFHPENAYIEDHRQVELVDNSMGQVAEDEGLITHMIDPTEYVVAITVTYLIDHDGRAVSYITGDLEP